MSKDGKTWSLASAALLLSGLLLGGCATSTAGSSLMDARAEVPAPKTTGYPAVEDLPPKPEKPAMTGAEQLKLKKELVAARDRQAAAAKARGSATRAEPIKP
jgi:hypothetical protein